MYLNVGPAGHRFGHHVLVGCVRQPVPEPGDDGGLDRGEPVHVQAAAPRPGRAARARTTGGGPTARCEIGSAGTQRDVDVLAVPRTNLRVNKAWYFSVLGLVEVARAAGYDLQGSLDPTVPSWMVTPGSWRSFEEQQWLYQNGFPANPPGKSMHEWGLAMDLDCNGHAIVKVRGCWNWVRTNGPAHGVYLFHKVDDMTDSEAGTSPATPSTLGARRRRQEGNAATNSAEPSTWASTCSGDMPSLMSRLLRR